MHLRNKKSCTRGITLIITLVFSATLTMSLMALMSFTLTQSQLGRTKITREQSLTIAEAGLEYYRWYLAHNPDDLTDGTNAAGPYVHAYDDPEGGELGNFALDISGNGACGSVQSIDIVSTGSVNTDTRFTRTVSARYARPSVAKFSYIINTNVLAGSSRDIVGPYHSNGGVRMDGLNHSIVSSSLQNWWCTSSFGCSPDQTVDGVSGSGAGNALWKYPVPQIDFAGISVDLANIKSHAVASGIYYPPYGGKNGRDGYHIIVRNNGTIDVYRVNSTNYTWGWTSEDGQWHREYHTITNETFYENRVISNGCPVIFVEDKLWLEGVVNNKMTIAAADLSVSNYNPNIILNDDITYTTSDGTVGLTAIAENSVLIPYNSGNNLTLRGIFIAQNGLFGRNYYSWNTRNNLNIRGSIISNGRVGTSWGCWWGFCSGYANRTSSYDRNLADNPPAFTPFTSEDYQFVKWRED